MNNNDQWFEPGQKVMRVSDNLASDCTKLGLPYDSPEFGEVLCVTECWSAWDINHVSFVGYPATYDLGQKIGFWTNNFRKVEEIKLCVEALKKAKPREKQEA